ncbi:AAA family ATPase [Corynebacterium glyciniphilum]|uniref:AAA family ATPase n=1 Tax=Corynebacterium glyciniphilum TaxID=1404244 RepID=UPI003FD3E26E
MTNTYTPDMSVDLVERDRITGAGSLMRTLNRYLSALGWSTAKATDGTDILVDRAGDTVATAVSRDVYRTDDDVTVSVPRGTVEVPAGTVLDAVDVLSLYEGDPAVVSLSRLAEVVDAREQRENAREQRLEDAIVRRRRTANRNIDREEAAELYGDVAEVEPLTGDAVVEVVAVAESFMVESLWSYTRPQVLLYAKAKVGKSTLAHNVVAALLAGTRLFGRYRVEAPAGRIGIIDTEMTAEHLTSEFGLHWPEVRDNRDRVKLWALGQKGAARQFDLTDPARRVQWAEKLRAEQIDVLVVDCLGPLLRAAGVKENEDAAVFMEHIREVCDRAGVKAHMIVDHASSKADGLAQGPRGDSKKQDTADALWKFYGAKTAKGEPVPGRFVLDVEGRDGSAKIDLYRETDGFRFHKVFYEDDPQYQVDADAHDLYPAARRALSAAGPLTQTKLVDAVYSTVKGAEGPGRERVRLAVKNLATQRCLTTTAGGDRGAITYAIGEGRPIKPTRPLPRADNGTYGGAPLTVSGVDSTTGA